MTPRAVILAGGTGSRLAPYTTVLPKPLMPVGDRPILDVIIRQRRASGVARMTIAVGYLGHLVQAVFGDGRANGTSIRYHDEHEPLGTAGPLATIPDLGERFLMLNGDVLTTLDFGELVRAHTDAGNALTIATHERVVPIDYGVLRVDGTRVVGYDEKPSLSYTVSMGVYVLEPEACTHVPRDRAFDFPELVLALLEAGRPVGTFPYSGYWLDIGRKDDHERALAEFDSLRPDLLPD